MISCDLNILRRSSLLSLDFAGEFSAGVVSFGVFSPVIFYGVDC